MKRYNPKEIEPRWQKVWDEEQVYKADLNSSKPKYIAMSMFNYPSGAGIHIGHAMNYTISDVMARFKRQQGFESYHPVGWDAFGLPAENYAIKAGVSPQQSMAKIIPSYHTQYKAMGWSNDWSKEISTHLPEYYRWTQWIFAEMYRQGLAYQDARMQWWCTKCQTVLANEQVIDGKCWRHDGSDDPEVNKKEVKQWFFRITDYADEILQATYDLDWSDVVKTAQINWIGKSQGAEVKFRLASNVIPTEAGGEAEESRRGQRDLSTSPLSSGSAQDDSQQSITVFTTRPDTLFGATFMVLAPEHPLVLEIMAESQRSEIEAYITEAAKKDEVTRQENKVKTGVFTGAYAINPVNGAKIPIWIADYVLMGYGTGAIMAVPAHDERDNEFAITFDLPITPVIVPEYAKYTVIEKSLTCANPEAALQEFGTLEVREKSQSWGCIWVVTVPSANEAAFRAFLKDNIEKHAEIGGWYADSMGSTNWVVFADESLHLKDAENFEAFKKRGAEIGIPPEQLDIPEPTVWHEEGVMMNSGEYDGMPSADAREQIIADLTTKGIAEAKTNYKIRDWSVSRQRYWGAPIPIVHCEKDGVVLVPDEQLPVVLPELEDFAPSGDGRSALARATEWLQTTCPTCGGPAERETDTLDTYICSSWYELRYFDPASSEKPFDSAIANKWMPIDFYNGGDHATAHLIYVRFIARFFHKLGLLADPEPFKKFLFNGKVTASDGTMFSKSKGNGVDPLEIIAQGYGADALRTYLMFAAPLDLWMRWDPQGVPGTYRFLNRVWNLVQEFVETEDGRQKTEENLQSPVSSLQSEPGFPVLRAIHPAIQKVTADLEAQRYNTAIAAMMEVTNTLYGLKAKDGFADRAAWQFTLESLVALVAPFAPHAADELWHDLGRTTSVQRDSWPVLDEQYLVADTVTLAVQINGKIRAEITVPSQADEATAVETAKQSEKAAAYLDGHDIIKTIYVQGKLISFVIR
jgi:leucyl-tRNA synthetase